MSTQKVVTDTDIGGTLHFVSNKLQVAVSATAGNTATVNTDGIYVPSTGSFFAINGTNAATIAAGTIITPQYTDGGLGIPPPTLANFVSGVSSNTLYFDTIVEPNLTNADRATFTATASFTIGVLVYKFVTIKTSTIQAGVTAAPVYIYDVLSSRFSDMETATSTIFGRVFVQTVYALQQ